MAGGEETDDLGVIIFARTAGVYYGTEGDEPGLWEEGNLEF